MTESKHYLGKLHRASEEPMDEYAMNILDDRNQSFAKVIDTVYYSYEQKEANAARIVQCWNEYDQLKDENERLKISNRVFSKHSKEVHQRALATEALNRELAEALQKALDTIETLATEFNYQSRRWRSEHIEPIINLIAKYNSTNQ